MRPLRIRRGTAGEGIGILLLQGSVDAHSSINIERTFRNLSAEGFRRIAIDLSDVDFISTAAVGTFIQRLQKIEGSEERLVLIAPSAPVLNTLSLLNMGKLFTIVPDEAAALAVLTGSEGERPPATPPPTGTSPE